MNLFPHWNAHTEIGPVRARNEDAYLVSPSTALFAIADGLGGLPGGAEASYAVLKRLVPLVSRSKPTRENEVAALMTLLNEELREEGQERFLGGFGTTLTLLLISGSEGLLGHVGDSSAWLFRKDSPGVKLTPDHTIAQRLRDAGHPGPGDPRDEHILTQCMGQEEAINPFILRIRFLPGDKVLLASDGVTGNLPLQETILNRMVTAKDLCTMSYEHGASDNATALLLEFTTKVSKDKSPRDEGPLIVQ
jgi:serine/threonine protein phosphatase PrpC